MAVFHVATPLGITEEDWWYGEEGHRGRRPLQESDITKDRLWVTKAGFDHL